MATIGELTTLYNELVIKVNSIISNSKSVNELTLQSPLELTSEIALNGGKKTTVQGVVDLLNSTGSIVTSYTTKDANYTITSNDSTIECISNSFTLTLPLASNVIGRIYILKNTGNGTITIDGNGSETIDGSLVKYITNNEAIILQSNGSNWIII